MTRKAPANSERRKAGEACGNASFALLYADDAVLALIGNTNPSCKLNAVWDMRNIGAIPNAIFRRTMPQMIAETSVEIGPDRIVHHTLVQARNI